MDTAEAFVCTVPSDSAVKNAELTCVGRSPDNFEVVGTVSDWFIVALTALLVIGAFMAWHKAKQTLSRMEQDASEAEARFKLDLVHRQSQHNEKMANESAYELLAASSDLVTSSGISLEAVYESSRGVKKAVFRYILANEITEGLGSLEGFVDVLVRIAKARFTNTQVEREVAKALTVSGYELLLQCLLAQHRGYIEMPDLLDSLYDFSADTKRKHWNLLMAADSIDQEFSE